MEDLANTCYKKFQLSLIPLRKWNGLNIKLIIEKKWSDQTENCELNVCQVSRKLVGIKSGQTTVNSFTKTKYLNAVKSESTGKSIYSRQKYIETESVMFMAFFLN